MDRPLWQKILYNAWPSIQRAIENFLFFVFRIIKAGFKIAMDQISKI